jgi:MarR family transcriptional regulator, lower aerobic nicotinate degradation pathway regulator
VAIREQPDVDATRLLLRSLSTAPAKAVWFERLENRGLIRRRRGADDKRIKRLRLNKRGSALLARVGEAVERAQQRILAPLAPAERRQFMAMLIRLVQVSNRYARVPLGGVAATAAGSSPCHTSARSPCAQ